MPAFEEPLAAANQQAWDRLYGMTADLVWGEQPIGFLEEFTPHLMPHRDSAARVLDAATGEGRNLPTLLRLGAEVYACDGSAHAIEKIPARIREQVRARVCDLYELPYPDECFDAILATDVIETLPEPLLALREMQRVLKQGGRLLCNIPGFEDGIAGIDMTPLGADRFLFRNRYFYQFLDEERARDLLARSDFVVLKSELRQWSEAAHPEFRSHDHVHTSRVFLAEKRVIQSGNWLAAFER
jgi:SAM-dependent methyltransferase